MRSVHSIKTPDSILYYLYRKLGLALAILENLICKFQQWEKRNHPHPYDKKKNSATSRRIWYDVIYPGQEAILSVNYKKQEMVVHSFNSNNTTLAAPDWSGVFPEERSNENMDHDRPTTANWHLIPWCTAETIKSNGALRKRIIKAFVPKFVQVTHKRKRKRVALQKRTPSKQRTPNKRVCAAAGTRRSPRILISAKCIRDINIIKGLSEKHDGEVAYETCADLHAIGFDDFVADPLIKWFDEDGSESAHISILANTTPDSTVMVTSTVSS